eukprot:3853578-Amphidinium_carterae.1
MTCQDKHQHVGIRRASDSSQGATSHAAPSPPSPSSHSMDWALATHIVLSKGSVQQSPHNACRSHINI